jgi:hypothetical protein
MRNSVKLIVLVSVATATLIFSCGKNEPKKTTDNENPYVKGNDSCSNCDRMKEMILADDYIDDKYIDSLYCDDNNGNQCEFKYSNDLLYSHPFLSPKRYIYYKFYFERDKNLYENWYADFMPNADTPFMGPFVFGFDPSKDKSKLSIIRGALSDELYYFNFNHFEYNSQGDYVRNPMYMLVDNKYPSPNVRIGQLQDTFTFWMREKKVIINGKERYFTVFHKFVLSPDRETMSLTARFIDLDRYAQTGDTTNPDFISRRYVLKRLK